MRVSIVIPVHNQKELLKQCIESVHRNSGKTEFQIILINDGSDKETTDYCREIYRQKRVHKLISNPQSKGFTESCNHGIKASLSFDYVCLLNSDARIVTYGWLDKITEYWEKNHLIGCVGVVSNCATTQSVGLEDVEESQIDAYGNWLMSLSENKYPETTFVNGFCFFISGIAIRKIGFLNTKEFPHYGSEDDYILRVLEAGFKTVIADDVYVYHFSNRSYGDRRDSLVQYSYPFLTEKWGSDLVVQYAGIAAEALNYLRIKLLSNDFNEDQNNSNLVVSESDVQMDDALELKESVCDIVLVVHNALDYVRDCIRSIEKYTEDYRLIIVDNDSSIDTKAYLKSLDDVLIITNNKNYGFGYANNQAIRQSNSEYICFLNSDTIVTSNWLNDLISILEKSEAGLVGPVTNHVSSEIQKADIDFKQEVNVSDDKIQDFSEKQKLEFKDEYVETNRLVGFCFVTKRKYLDEVGYFDDRYKFNFEDDDLCLRFIEKGYRLICAKEIFIYHFGSKSFIEKPNFFDETMNESKELFLEKWHSSSRIKRIQEEKKKFSIIYILASNVPCGGVKIIFEQANRLKERGYNISIWCQLNISETWFDVTVPVYYFREYTEIPQSDIAIGTFYTTLDILQKVKAKVKIHLCQGYEALLFCPVNDKMKIEKIRESYLKIKEKIVVSTWLKELIQENYDIDAHYIPNGIDPYVFSFKKHKRNSSPKILIVGNGNLYFKGVDIAINAVKNFKAYKKVSIIRMSSERSRFDSEYEFFDMTHMSQDEIAQVYASCDVTINASHRVEGFSLPPLESMASGTPVITTNCGGINTYAVNGKNSIVVAPQNAAVITNALDKLFSDNFLYSRLIFGGLETAKEYLWYKSIDKLESHLERLYLKSIGLGKERLSVCMIVKNEEDCLGTCLESIKSVASEIIIIDTGSTDDTIKIAKKFGATIFHFDWINDFSAARNFSLEKASQPWILVLDADEKISKADIENLKNLLKGPDRAYSFTTRNYMEDRSAEGITTCIGEYEEEEKEYIGWCRSDKVRLFPNNPEIKFSGHIHELVEPSVDKLGLETKLCDIPIHHYSKLNKEKSKEYLKLSKKKAELSRKDPKALYELATQYMALDDNDEALVVWRRLLEVQPDNSDVLAHLGTTYNLLGDYKQAEKYFNKSLEIAESKYCLNHLGICFAKQEKYEDAYFAFKKIAYATDDLKLMADFAFCCNNLKKFDEAIIVLEKCLKLNHKETVSWGLLEIAYNEKGIELINKNKFLLAVRMFKSALSINPDFDIAKSNLSVVNKLMETQQFSKKFIKHR